MRNREYTLIPQLFMKERTISLTLPDKRKIIHGPASVDYYFIDRLSFPICQRFPSTFLSPSPCNSIFHFVKGPPSPAISGPWFIGQ